MSATEMVYLGVAAAGVLLIAVGIGLIRGKIGEALGGSIKLPGDFELTVKSLGQLVAAAGLILVIGFMVAFGKAVDSPTGPCIGSTPNYPASPETASQQPPAGPACLSAGDTGSFFGGELRVSLGQNSKSEVRGLAVAADVRQQAPGSDPNSLRLRAACHQLPSPENGDELEVILAAAPPASTFVFRIEIDSVHPGKIGLIVQREAVIEQRRRAQGPPCFLNGRAS
jgi:hypothetical protein